MNDAAQSEHCAHASPNGSITQDPVPQTPTAHSLTDSSTSLSKKHDSRPHSRSGPSASPLSWLNNLRRPKTAPGQGQRPPPPFFARSQLNDDPRRDSALQPASVASTMIAPSTVLDGDSGLSRVSSLPAIVVQDSNSEDVEKLHTRKTEARDRTLTEKPPTVIGAQQDSASFSGITMAIPTGGLEDLSSPEKIQFSKRGSMLLDGKKATQLSNGTATSAAASLRSPSLRTDNGSRTSLTARQSRVLSADESELSQRVRSMYEFGNERGVDWSERTVLDDMVMEEDEAEVGEPGISASQTSTLRAPKEPGDRTKKRASIIPWEPYEAAGGLEDWQDVAADEVDRYGFIIPKKSESRGSNASGNSPQLMRVSTVLVELSESPRRKRTVRRSASRASQKVENGGGKLKRQSSKSSRNSLRPPASVYSTRSNTSLSIQQNPLRYASNRLPHNRERRWMDEASDMLTLPPGLEELAVAKEGGKASAAMKKKELQREEKWRKMGRLSTKSGMKGEGMQFNFDPKDPKVISRTWKGIPDKWRASAWYSFLAASAKNHKDSHSDEELTEIFHALQDDGSPDDVQIDCDVPRTVNRHIMFRRRYRGGQRLLFRVLHAMSLYFPDNGYVQGMAAIAATLLCYYDEEHAFIMMVRLWQLRGLNRLYMAGFEGLMEALEDFEKNWLRGNDVAKKLEELGITSTAYGTRWYLTMFNYSIPFPAQLRVWDAFMLLGDVTNSTNPDNVFGADLDVLHATSAALIDATREILLDSDFENAMKVLTSWIPVKDEDLLMKVAFAEWKQRKKRA
ncbi:uncharacterized protein PV09_03361 [Verruconis gallopava]|uniref:Rab-GAP TBC domain-containing protein n=1 Tax=Verruconis gallopava TaxID=253628 RepID=A0A0D1XS10_9PEZI|nr:uncharacterized protein PV09_03361 [Verruconis gallopava]KIW05476.1 hypothetical protein PV09_03361 [Verruconis gallopava]